MKLSKYQQEVYSDLMLILKRRGRAYLLGWALGQLLKLSQNDPNLRRAIKQKSHD